MLLQWLVSAVGVVVAVVVGVIVGITVGVVVGAVISGGDAVGVVASGDVVCCWSCNNNSNNKSNNNNDNNCRSCCSCCPAQWSSFDCKTSQDFTIVWLLIGFFYVALNG